MASFTIRKTSWCLEMIRTSRVFSVSFTTALPREGRTRRLPSPPPAPLTCATRLRTPARGTRPPHSHSNATACRAFATSSRPQQQATAQNPSSLDLQSSSQSQDSIVPNTDDLAKGLKDSSLEISGSDGQVDWTRSFQGLSSEAFSPEAAKILLTPVDPDDIEIKMDGILYLPEIKYRRILNQAFGPGGWGLAPRGETIVTSKAVTREYALVVLGRLVSVARGEQDYFNPDNIPTAVEGCKSTALRRCCKDLGIASELWDPRFIRDFMKTHVKEVFVEHMVNKKKKKIYLRKAESPQYPWKETR